MHDSTVLEGPRIDAPAWARLTALAGGRWRVTDARGVVVGHLRAVADARGWRYRAERFRSTSHGFRVVGEFWRPIEALDCLRYTR